jgi:predicted nucleic acid-binding protein
MILVDTSIWIELLRGRLETPDLDLVLHHFAHCPPIIQEILQGIGTETPVPRIQQNLLAFPTLSNPIPLELYLEAAAIYRLGRRKGISLSSSNDCLIAAVAIHHKVPVWHRDRDFSAIARFTALEEFHPS